MCITGFHLEIEDDNVVGTDVLCAFRAECRAVAIMVVGYVCHALHCKLQSTHVDVGGLLEEKFSEEFECSNYLKKTELVVS